LALGALGTFGAICPLDALDTSGLGTVGRGAAARGLTPWWTVAPAVRTFPLRTAATPPCRCIADQDVRSPARRAQHLDPIVEPVVGLGRPGQHGHDLEAFDA
jgi:hypothetical protein